MGGADDSSVFDQEMARRPVKATPGVRTDVVESAHLAIDAGQQDGVVTGLDRMHAIGGNLVGAAQKLFQER